SMLVFSMYLIARGLYADPPTLLEHFVIVPIGMLASALPITPAGIGVLEATIQSLYSIVPAVPTSASGTLVALVFEMVKVVMAIIGTIFYWTANEEVRESLESAEEEAAAEA
ncbi:MAG: lysylphosphatidylglycerol synthase domain-containing protein, partial [Rubripirellula sp.]